jgi:hypothetical protein
MKFLCLFYFAPDAFAGVSADEMARIDDATIEHDQKLRAAGHLLYASPLVDVSNEVSIDRRPVRMAEIDGPYSESKEVLGGVVLLEAGSVAEAKALFSDDPIAGYARIQIRALRDDDRHSQTGEGRPAPLL